MEKSALSQRKRRLGPRGVQEVEEWALSEFKESSTLRGPRSGEIGTQEEQKLHF